jgi:uncharacterized protein DUF4349
MPQNRRARLLAIVTGAVVLIAALAFLLGGHGSSEDGGSAGSASSAPGVALPPATAHGAPQAAAPEAAPSAANISRAATGSAAVSSAIDADAVTGTRVVKTGSLNLQVARGQVQSTVTKLITLTTTMGGYVSQSRTDNEFGQPSGGLTIRIPVNRFDQTVSSAEQLGHVVSLTTNAHDVTGQVVDLGAQVAALQQTRATYLTILGRATTIGATLEVQQRVDAVQQQIQEIQGELKVLRNQSADGTLTVDISQVGSKAKVVTHHKQGGIGKAWHSSVSRFNRGFDAIVGALGPLLLAVLVLAALAGIGRLGYRGVRRVAGE